MRDSFSLLIAMLACCCEVEDCKSYGIDDDTLVGEVVRKLIPWDWAFKTSLTPLFLVSELDVVDNVLRSKQFLVLCLHVLTHMVKTFQIHGLGLCMPDFVPFALRQCKLSHCKYGFCLLTCVNRHSSSFCFNLARTVGSTAIGSLNKSIATS